MLKKLWHYQYWFLLGFVIWVISYTLTPPQLPQTHINETKADYIFTNVTISLLRNGNVDMKLTAETASTFKDKGITLVEDVSSNFYNNGVKTAHISAPVAHIYTKKNQFSLRQAEATFYTMAYPIHLSSDTMTWNDKRNQIYGDGRIIITTKGIQLTSNQFISDLSKKTVQITGQPKAIIQDSI